MILYYEVRAVLSLFFFSFSSVRAHAFVSVLILLRCRGGGWLKTRVFESHEDLSILSFVFVCVCSCM